MNNQIHPSDTKTDFITSIPKEDQDGCASRQEPDMTDGHREHALLRWMKRHRKGLKRAGVVLLLFCAWFLGASGLVSLPGTVLVYSTDSQFRTQLQKISAAQSIISSQYTGEIDRDKMADEMLKAMFDSLGDPYSTYYTSDVYTNILQQMTGTFGGIGVYMNMEDPQNILITKLVPDGPAEKAGIQSGDILRKVGGSAVSGMEYPDILNLTAGEIGTQVEVTVERGGEEKTFTVTRGEVSLNTVSSALIDGVGYVYLSEFGKGSADEFIGAVEELKQEGADSLIVDLRYNGGGLLDTAVEILDYLLPEGKLGTLVNADGVVSAYESDSDALGMPFVVLVNGESASASEFTSGNIQQMGGTIIGETTYGKGVAQNMSGFLDGSGYKLTVQEYFVGDGVRVNQVGITPDVSVATDADILTSESALEEDAQLQKALELLRSGQIAVLGGQE